LTKISSAVNASELTNRITRTPFPGSSRIIMEGSRPDIRVQFREVTLTDTLVQNGTNQPRCEAKPPLRLYDPTGVYTDPAQSIDITRGLQALRANWIAERADTEALSGISSAYVQQRLNDPQLQALRMAQAPVHRRAIAGANVSQMHHAKKGIITPEMEYIAIRENLVLAQPKERLATERLPKPGQSFGALMQQQVTPEFVRGEVALAQSAKPSYLAIGPVYPTTLKVMPYHAVGLERLRAWTQRVSPCPVAAIGGI
jgi:phosphomethylpyrimidine synthase